MRWYIEVSRVGEAGSAEQYCVEAKQWQGALQEARRLRGDSGPLSKFSIELLDSGYRAVDPKLNIRYLVHRAPRDAPLTEGARVIDSQPGELRPDRSSQPPRAAARSSGSIQPTAIVEIGGLRVPSDPVPPPASRPSAPPATGAERANSGTTAPFEVIRKREEEPTAATPITYREYAYRVERGTARATVEALLWKCFREISSVLEPRPKGKFVQLAVFDHAFEGAPLAPALATLSWKDWRGEPVLDFPAYTHATLPQPAVAERVSGSAASVASQRELDAAPQGEAELAPELEFQEQESAEPELEVGAEADLALPSGTGSEAPISEPVMLMRAKTDVGADGVGNGGGVTEDVNDFELLIESGGAAQAPAKAAAPTSSAAEAPAAVAAPAPAASAPATAGAPRRRQRSSEDLIGELFETMHELHFLPDLISGAEFVLKVLHGALPCELTLVHVFDINTRQFVVVRASGPGSDKLVLHRTADADPVLAAAMHRRRSLRADHAAGDPRYASARWQLSGVQPKHAVCGAVQQHGRYLGALELVNPLGSVPFSESELNALDYICEQFAGFVASRPIIIDADVVLAAPRR